MGRLMTFLEALGSWYFWGYTLAAAILLGTAAGGLVWLRRRGRPTEELWRLFGSWAVLFVLTVVGILLGREVFVALVVLASLLACHEFARATGLFADWLFTGLVYLAILGTNAAALWGGYDLFAATPIYAVAGLCLLPVLRNQAEGMLPRVALAVIAFVYFGYLVAHLSLLAGRAEGDRVAGYLFFLLYGSAVVGLTADLGDRKLGRHPIAPGISRDKTWEGAAAGLAVAFLWSFTLGWTLPGFDALALLLCALILGVMSVVGELVMRYFLRDHQPGGAAGASLIDPVVALGHLNRLIFVAPLFFRVVHLFAGA
jgi:phosphatidate cytidylyltransferase